MHVIVDRRPALLTRLLAPFADRTLVALLALALLVRVGAVVAFPSLHHPDENFQLFEQAHRIAFGYGVVPWEFRDGIRSPVLPYSLAGLFWLGEHLFGGPRGYLLVARIALAVFSLAAVAAVYRMGRRTSPVHALLAGLVAATWFELVYFAGRPLTEAVATTVLIVALALISVPRPALTFRRLLAIGFCLALTLMLRIHLAAGLLVAAAFAGRLDLRRGWLPLAIGGLAPLLAFGAADWLYWGAPFDSYIAAIRINLIDDKASAFGIETPLFYFEQLADVWGGALPIMAALIVLRARSSAVWIATALAIVVCHMAIPHKEYRFVFPAFACIAVVAAMGSADVIEWLRTMTGRASRAAVVVAGALWVGTSAALAFTPGFVDEWYEGRDLIEASFALSSDPDLCGLLFYNDDWAETGGYAHLHRNVPIYALMDDQETAQASTAAFNAIVLSRQSIDDFTPEFTLVDCQGDGDDDDTCIMKRTGTCTPIPNLTINQMLRRIDE